MKKIHKVSINVRGSSRNDIEKGGGDVPYGASPSYYGKTSRAEPMLTYKKIGITDTTFATIDMAKFALDIFKNIKNIKIVRYTVPGVKDLPVACKRLFTDHNCDIVLSLGIVGKEPVDKTCGHEAALGHQMVQTSLGKHIVEAFVHMDESKDDKDLFELTKNRVSKHALNVLELLKGPTALQKRAGTGKRQGRDDVGQIKVKNQ